MRGQHLFNDLFADTLPPVVKQPGKGRNQNFDALRNELLIHRYFYYGKFHNELKYEVIISRLSEQFFLTERRIQDVISENAIALRQLRQDPPTVPELKKRWPHLVW